MRKIACCLAIPLLMQTFLAAQSIKDSIRKENISSVLNFLASDQLKGRANFSPELVTAANFIRDKFWEYGLQPLSGSSDFYQPFNAGNAKDIFRDQIRWNEKKLDQSQFVYFTGEIWPEEKKLTDFNLVEYNGAIKDSLFLSHWMDTTNTLIWWKTNSDKQKIILENFRSPGFPPQKNILFVASPDSPKSVIVKLNDEYKTNVLFNIIGVLPGKTKANEIIIFSAHYDHIGNTYNGANDDVSGVAAVLTLAKYFAMRNNNERSIFFCAFAGEELGLFGSSFLSDMLKSGSVKAMINIEMIGIPQYGKRTVFITGENFSSLPGFLKENLPGLTIRKEPIVKWPLFKRSDNYMFARKGIPAHTIMSSDDFEDCYHKPCDDVKRIDIENMEAIINSIAAGCNKLIQGEETPTRINPGDLND